METTAIADARLISGSPASKPKSRGQRPHGPIKPVPFTRADLDSRTAAARMWDNLSANIAADLGGEANLSSVQKTLIEAFVGVSIRLNDLNMRGLRGEQIDLSELSLAASTLVRIASRIGIARVARDVGSSLGDLLRQDHERQQREKQA
jgi:hypothetical protein